MDKVLHQWICWELGDGIYSISRYAANILMSIFTSVAVHELGTMWRFK